MSSQVSVDIKQSQEIGSIIKSLNFKEDFLNREFLSLQILDETKTAMYYYAVGICHQTYHLAHPPLNLFGWDFLEYGFINIAKQKPELFQNSYLNKIDKSDLIKELKPFFSTDENPENCTLDNLEERADLWLNMAEFSNQFSDGFLSFIKNAENDADKYYSELRKTEAYSDPLQKKTSFLMKLLEDSGYAQFDLNQDLIPIMDYHMQRVLLRTGCVIIEDETLKLALQERQTIESDQAIREACIESMKMIAKTSGYSVFKMNDVFYTMGRSCCNESMLCQDHICEKTPCTLSLAVELGDHRKCIFQSFCKGENDSSYRKYWQPQVETHFY